MRAVIPLSDPAAADPAVTGHKAANLARLVARGLPVVPGFALTAPACQHLLAASGLAAGASPEHVRALSLPVAIREDLRGALAAFGDVAFAVRSSGLAEDLAGASFAGQYESVLGARGIDEVSSAILRCLASAFSGRVSAYRGAGADGAAPMAVLIQPMVAADAAGVAFTANPITGDRDEIHVNAIRGLGERLVGGVATPDEWVVRDGAVEARATPEGALTADQALRIAELAARVEAALGSPQDVEWALSANRVLLLQARPITALPHPPRLDVPAEGFWFKDEMHFHAPLTPFGASFYPEASAGGLLRALQRFGVPLERVEERAFGGEVYTRAVPLGGKERRAPPRWLMALIVRLMPPMRRCAAIAEDALRPDFARRAVDQWDAHDRNALRREAAQLRRREVTALTDDALIEYLDQTIDLLHRGEVAHFNLLVPYALVLQELCRATRDLLGWSTPQTLALLSGLSGASSEPGRRVKELAEFVAQNPAARQVLETGGDLAKLRVAAPDVAAAWQAYLDDYGHRPFGYDPGEPTLAERPHLLSELVRDRLGDVAGTGKAAQSVNPRDEALRHARSRLSAGSPEQRERFEQVLATAERIYRVRDDSLMFGDFLPGGLAHRAGIEIGRRLTERGVLVRAEDAMFLGHRELRAALLRGASTDLRATVARRRAERAWVAVHPGPPAYGRDPGPAPDLRSFPKALRRVLGAMTWYQAELSSSAGERPTPGVLHGVAGAPGRYSGPARVIGSERDFDRLRPGDVLVCSTTSPAWSVLFLRAGALVTDFGGALSHAAIIAREYGIPAVLSTRHGTQRLRDGQVITVDGTAGVVLAEEVAARPPERGLRERATAAPA